MTRTLGCKANIRNPAAAVVDITASHKPPSWPTWNHGSALVIKGPAQSDVSPSNAQPRRPSEQVSDVLLVQCPKELKQHIIAFGGEDASLVFCPRALKLNDFDFSETGTKFETWKLCRRTASARS